MKQNIILWIVTIIIVFLAGYMSSATGPYYPISGTIGLEGQPATFKFDRIYKGNEGYIVTVSTEVKNLNAFLLWRIASEVKITNPTQWQKIEMSYSGNIYSAKLPVSKPGQKISYRVVLNYKGNQYYLPVDKPVTIQLWGKVNPEVLQIFYFILFGGLILAVRTGLEVFKDKPKMGIYTIFTGIFFFLYAICLVPLVKSYELNAINHKVPPVLQLLTVQSVSLLILWILGMAAIFNIKGNKSIPLILSAATLVIYVVIHF
jgi:hypothetical protein